MNFGNTNNLNIISTVNVDPNRSELQRDQKVAHIKLKHSVKSSLFCVSPNIYRKIAQQVLSITNVVAIVTCFDIISLAVLLCGYCMVNMSFSQEQIVSNVEQYFSNESYARIVKEPFFYF